MIAVRGTQRSVKETNVFPDTNLVKEELELSDAEQQSFPPLFVENVTVVKCENDQLVDENSSDCNQTEENDDLKETLPIRRGKSVKKTAKHLQANREKGLILDAHEYIEMIASQPEERLNCAICDKTYSTSLQTRRHEIEVHLMKEERNKFRTWRITNHVKTNKGGGRKKGLTLGIDEFTKIVGSLPEERPNCAICKKEFSTSLQRRRHEPEAHLTAENRNKFRTWRNKMRGDVKEFQPRGKTVKKTSGHLQANIEKGLILDAYEYREMIISLPDDRLNCAICDKIYSTTLQVRRHELEVHLMKEERNKFRTWRSTIQTKVVKEVPTIEPTMCDICNKPFKHIEAHKISHVEVSSEVVVPVEGSRHPQYRCLNCNTIFPYKDAYLAHTKRQCELKEIVTDTQEVKPLEKEKNFLCTQCGQAFNRKYTLKIHVLAVHEKKKDFKCQYCPASFTVELVKKNHEKKHLGTSTVTCDLCGFTFSSKQILRKHIRGVHENHRPFQCQLCDKRFKTSNARNYHLNTHGNPNGRKRGLNRDVDPMQAAAKRRKSIAWQKNRVQRLTDVVAADTSNDEKSSDQTSFGKN